MKIPADEILTAGNINCRYCRQTAEKIWVRQVSKWNTGKGLVVISAVPADKTG